tara:strand:- start:109 stop:465 length:357 start_codon:yes stop_codon:yes gene_type:complete
MKKLCLGFLAMTMATTVFAGAGNSTQYTAWAKIVDIEEVWRTAKVKRYSDCRDILDKKDGLTGRKTLCETIEWETINKTIDHYRVSYDLYGKIFTLHLKSRPIGTKKRMTVWVTPYDK